ncbi:MAG: metal ABC transporter substrate-binding protein [Gammaproteobacteria bacterium]
MIPSNLCLPFLLALGLGMAGIANAAGPLKVVATFSILGDMVKNVGGDHIALTTLVGADGDAHVFQPSPADAKAVADANLVIMNGLGFEGWMERLLESAQYQGKVAVASAGVKAQKMPDDFAEEEGHASSQEQTHDGHGATDPHAWQSLGNGKRYVGNIVNALADADPTNAGDYQARGKTYLAALDQLDQTVKAAFDAIPKRNRKVITSHDAFGYFGAAYGVTFLAPVGISTEAEPSAGEVAKLIKQIRKHDIRAVFVENITDIRLVEQITRETKTWIGGTLYSDALSGADGPAPTYIDMFRHNVKLLTDAMGGR